MAAANEGALAAAYQLYQRSVGGNNVNDGG